LTRFVSDRSSRRRDPNDDEEGAESAEEDDEDDLTDGLDDLDVGEGSGRSKAKYMKVLRKVANRQSAAVTIDLNDVKEVSQYCCQRSERGTDG
jgi:DNA replication licensing factor MCM7